MTSDPKDLEKKLQQLRLEGKKERRKIEERLAWGLVVASLLLSLAFLVAFYFSPKGPRDLLLVAGAILLSLFLFVLSLRVLLKGGD